MSLTWCIFQDLYTSRFLTHFEYIFNPWKLEIISNNVVNMSLISKKILHFHSEEHLDSVCTFFLTSSILSQKKWLWLLSIFLVCELVKSILLVSVCPLQSSWFTKSCTVWGFCCGVMRYSLFWDVRQHWLVVSYWCFGMNCQSQNICD